MANKYYVGDIGTDIIVDCGEDISAATVKRIKYRKPDGTEGYWEADVYLSNYLKYTVLINDWDLSGKWSINSYIEIGTWKGHGETDWFVLDSPYS